MASMFANFQLLPSALSQAQLNDFLICTDLDEEIIIQELDERKRSGLDRTISKLSRGVSVEQEKNVDDEEEVEVVGQWDNSTELQSCKIEGLFSI